MTTTVTARRAPDRWTLALPGGRRLVLAAGRPRVVGILNITPDSFSDGGLFDSPQRALDQALRLADEGAELLDLGAESTRPGGGVYGAGARSVPAEEEIGRLLPVLDLVRERLDLPLSVDTRKAIVARAALDAGADIVNDVSALADPAMAEVVAAAGCPVVLMHSRGDLATMQTEITFRDVLGEVRGELAQRRDHAVAAGIDPSQVVLDPGLGFGKTGSQNLALLAGLEQLAELGSPLLVGASRKSFLGEITGEPPAGRLAGSLAAAAWSARGGAALLRVHDVAATRRFLDTWTAIADAGGEP